MAQQLEIHENNHEQDDKEEGKVANGYTNGNLPVPHVMVLGGLRGGLNQDGRADNRVGEGTRVDVRNEKIHDRDRSGALGGEYKSDLSRNQCRTFSQDPYSLRVAVGNHGYFAVVKAICGGDLLVKSRNCRVIRQGALGEVRL